MLRGKGAGVSGLQPVQELGPVELRWRRKLRASFGLERLTAEGAGLSTRSKLPQLQAPDVVWLHLRYTSSIWTRTTAYGVSKNGWAGGCTMVNE